MSQNMGSSSSLQPLSVGNVVSAGLRLYRSHLKSYFGLALKAYLWILVPVYGWAKFSAIAALISRLAFGELVNQPESVKTGSRYVNSKLWQFLITALLMGLIGLSIFIGFFVLFILFMGLFAGLTGVIQFDNPIVILLAGLLTLIIVIAFTFGILWLLARFYVFEVPLAIEDNVDAISTISRSWELTKGYFWRILAISFIAFLITFPLQILVQVVSWILQIVFTSLIEQNPVYGSLLFLLVLSMSIVSGAVILPLSQAIKAVVYYDLRTRREGLGLKLRDRQI